MRDAAMLQTVLFNPCAWIHKDRLVIPENFNNQKCLGLINQALIKQYSLGTEIPEIVKGSLTGMVIEHWFALPRISRMLACQRYRAALQYQGEFNHLSASDQNFCKLESADVQPVYIGRPIMSLCLDACGAHMLISLSPLLPRVIAQRIPLLFSESAMLRQLAPAPKALSPMHFKLAIQYAQHSASL